MSDSKKAVLMLASVASMIDQFNMPNIRLLQEMGYEVHVACNFKEGNTCDARRIRKLKETLASMQVVWHQWDCPRDVASIKKCWNAYCQLRRFFRDNTFAWMHCHSPVGGALARIAARTGKIRVIYTAHGFHFYRGAPLRNWMFYYPVEKLLAGWTDVLITINREDYRFAGRRLKAGAVCYIPGVGIDVERFSDSDGHEHPKVKDAHFLKKYDIPQNAVVFLSTGELNRRKNHRVVLAVLAALKRDDVYYLICGQGPQREELQREAERLGIERYVRMPGYQEEMPWIYRNADIFIFPSLQEGLPAALMEAMAAGLPCVVSDIRGNRELIPKSERFSLNHAKASCGVVDSKKRFGGRYSYGYSQELLTILKRMLDDIRYREMCGCLNQKHVKKYGLTAAETRMRKIYEMEEAYASGISHYASIQYGSGKRYSADSR